MPHPFESVDLDDSAGLFTSQIFGHAGFAQLSQTAPSTLTRGAENGTEIGAFGSLANAIKLDSLSNKVEEYMPFGLIPIFVLET